MLDKTVKNEINFNLVDDGVDATLATLPVQHGYKSGLLRGHYGLITSAQHVNLPHDSANVLQKHDEGYEAKDV